MQWQKRVFYHLSAENDVKCDGMCVFHIHSSYKLHNICSHGMMFYKLERRNVPLSFGLEQYLFGLASFL